MKILIAIDDNNSFKSKLSFHFGHCPYFAIYSTDSQDLKIIRNELDHSNPDLTPVDQISKLNIDAVFSLGMGKKAIALFNQKGIKIKTGKFKNIEELTKGINQLEELKDSCLH